MPIHACTLPHGKIGYKWGHEGHCYSTKAEAAKKDKQK